MKLFGVVFCIILSASLLATGCGQGSREEQGAGTDENSSVELGSKAQQESTYEEETAQLEGPFTAAPEMSGGAGRAADSIQEVTFDEHEGYERVVMNFGSAGTAASLVPTWSLSSPTGEGYVRLTFPSVEATLVPDGAFGGSIMKNFYVVRAPGEGMFVDVFATGAFQYRVTELSDPGRLVLDYQPASVELSLPIPAQAQKTVLLEPRKGEAITSPLRVSGYSRNFEASNTIILRDLGGDVLSEDTAMSNDWAEAWGYFEGWLEFPPFEGQATLQIGRESPRDGSFEGVEVPVTYGTG